MSKTFEERVQKIESEMYYKAGDTFETNWRSILWWNIDTEEKRLFQFR